MDHDFVTIGCISVRLEKNRMGKIGPLENSSREQSKLFPLLGWHPENIRRFWLKTNAFIFDNAERWLVSLVDKDNAFRKPYLVQ